MKLGVCLESLALPFRAAVDAASRLGVNGVQFDAAGDLHPGRLSATGRREITHLLRSNGLQATALHCPLRGGIDDPKNLDQRLERMQHALTLSCDLGARIVIIDAGRLPKPDEPRWAGWSEALRVLGSHADRIGAMLALTTGLETGEGIDSTLIALATPSIGVNFDPGNLIAHGFDPVEQLAPLRGRIIHVHAHDARRGASGRLAAVEFGAGDVDWLALVGHLSAQEYRGWLVLRTDEPNANAVTAGVKWLRRLA